MELSGMQPIARRCLALWLPYFACERVRRAAGQTILAPPEPLALVSRTGNALRLSAVDAFARKAGLDIGMTLADARARCPSLVTRPADPVLDACELDRLVKAMVRFTPIVAADPPDGIVLDVTGCAHLFDGEDALARQAMALAGYTARHASGPNAAAARALARYGAGSTDVQALPVAALELPEEAQAALRRAGLRRIGDLASRPMQTLAARFGEEMVARLRGILGESASPIAPRRVSAPVRFAVRFPEPLVRTDDALEAIEGLLEQAARDMEARQLGGRRFAVMLCRSDNVRRRLIVDTGRPERDPAIILRLLHERIETLSDPLDPGFGFDSIELAILRAESLPSRQMALEGAREGVTGDLSALIDRLSVRFGPDRVHCLTPCDRHLPERTQRLEPAAQAQAQKASWPDMGDRPPRPLLLLDPPQRVDVIAEVPDGPPQRFRWNGKLHEVRLAEGPERIGAEWWRKRTGHLPEGRQPTRDYYRIEDADGRRYWIFRHGLFEEAVNPPWYLHGLFP